MKGRMLFPDAAVVLAIVIGLLVMAFLPILNCVRRTLYLETKATPQEQVEIENKEPIHPPNSGSATAPPD